MQGPQGMVREGSQAQPKLLSWERLALGASCPADVPGRMQLRRAIASGQASVFPGRWLPTSPLSPCCIPRWINVQENPAPGLLKQVKCQGKSAGGCSPAPGARCLHRDGFRQRFGPAHLCSQPGTVLGHTDPSQPRAPCPCRDAPSKRGLESPEPCWALHHHSS